MNSSEKRILMATCYGHFISHFNMLVFPAVLLPLTHRLGMNMADVLGLSFFMYFMFGITSLPWGILADRWGARPLFLIYFVGTGFSGFLAALNIDHPVRLTFFLGLIGCFSGIYHPVGLGMISKSIRRVSMAMGFNGMFGNLGLALSPLLIGIVNWIYGPREAYFLLGGLNLTGVGLVFLLPQSVRKDDTPTAAPENRYVLAPFLILLIVMMLGGIVYRGATVILPAYFELKNAAIFQLIERFFGVTPSANLIATSTTSFIFITGMIGQFAGGWIAERFPLKWSYFIFHLITIPAAVGMGHTEGFLLLGVTIVYFFFLLGMQPIENTLVARFTPQKFQSSAFGAKFVLTFGVGAFAVSMVKYIEQAYAIESVFPCLGLISVLLVVGIVILIKWTTP